MRNPFLRLAGFACLTVVALAGESKISKDLKGLHPDSAVEVIVQFTQPPTEAHHGKVRAKGGVMKVSLDGINGALYSMPAGAAVELSDDPDVLYVSPDRPVQGALDYAEPTTNANIAFQSGWDGKGIGIALIDSGVTARPDLQYLSSKASRIV